MSTGPVFSTRVLGCLVAAVAITFAASMLLSIQGGETAKTDETIGANTYSRSAVGYAGLYNVLQKRDLRAVQAQFDVLAKLGGNGLLVLAEPSRNLAGDELRNRIFAAKNILLILPKWNVQRSEHRRDWIGSARLTPVDLPQSVYSLVSADGEVVRVAAGGAFTRNVVGHSPSLSGTMQLIRNSKMRWLAGTPEGMILGEIEDKGRRIWVLSDPDIAENHGIGKGDNAAFLLVIVQQLAGGSAPIVFDETIHGFTSSAKPPMQLLLGFPYNLLALQAVMALGLLLLATTGRFGVPQILPPALGAGKRGLIANAALLIDFGGHHAAVLKRYAQTSLRDAARQLRAPGGLEGAALTGWLDRASKARGLPDSASDLLSKAENASSSDLARLFATARSLYFWKKELLNGTARRPHDH